MMKLPQRRSQLRRRIFRLVKEYYRQFHPAILRKRPLIQYGGRVYDEREMIALVDAALEFWITYGWRSQRFEKQFANYLGVKHAVFVNSGSSANLLAIASLCAPSLKNRLKPGDEVITPATTFPTTVNPLILHGLRPVLVDSDVGTYNINTSQVSKAISKKTRAIMLPHMLGNPADLGQIMEIANKYDLYLLEDVCESLSAKYGSRYLGTAGDISTFSLYGPHHMTTGEGGVVCTDDDEISQIVISLRDWGRTWRKHSKHRRRELPEDYDSRNTYETRGYNFRPLDLEAAIGCVQLAKLSAFSRARKANFQALYRIFGKYGHYFVLPRSLRGAEPVWFAFPLTVKRNSVFRRRDIVAWLEKHNIETRSVLAGNILHQPAYAGVRFRVVGKLHGADEIMRSSFFIGLYPGIGSNEIRYMETVVDKFFHDRGIAF
jgi:CDP-6-deoxy-D-xylo-4-hexulose-3-dehydrase